MWFWFFALLGAAALLSGAYKAFTADSFGQAIYWGFSVGAYGILFWTVVKWGSFLT